MTFFSFTGLGGSLIHPIFMILICLGWMGTFTLGWRVRRKRLLRLRPGEDRVLLVQSGGVSLEGLHHKASASLVFLTILTMLTGMGNTFMRTGRLFPGPHLYGGLLLTLAASANVALVPWFKGTPLLRVLHTGIGLSILALVFSQMYSGIPILISVINTVS